MKDRYYLFVRPDKADRRKVEPHSHSEGVIRRIDFLRRYYKAPPAEYADLSVRDFFKVDISSDVIDFRLYLNNDAAGTVDLSIPGLGVIYSVSAAVAFKWLMIFQCFNKPEHILKELK